MSETREQALVRVLGAVLASPEHTPACPWSYCHACEAQELLGLNKVQKPLASKGVQP